MGTIVRRGEKFRAVVRIGKHRARTKTFEKHGDAKKWITKVEAELIEKKVTNPKLLVGDLLDAYERDILPRRKARMAPGHWKRDLPALKNRFSTMRVVDFEGDGVITWALSSAADLLPSSRACYLDRLLGFFRQCEFHFKTVIPWGDIATCRKKLFDAGEFAKNNERDRRISPEEVARIKANLPPCHAMPMDRIIDFCIASCMRISEVFRIRWSEYNREAGTVIIRDRKHPKKKIGNHKVVPLLGDAIRLIEEQRTYVPLRKRKKDNDLIFPHDAIYASGVFHQAVLKAGIEDMVLHDTRHEGISRLFEMGYEIQEVALVSGHLNWKALQRYTHIQPTALAMKDRLRQELGVSNTLGMLDGRAQIITKLLDSPQLVRLLTERLAA